MTYLNNLFSVVFKNKNNFNILRFELVKKFESIFFYTRLEFAPFLLSNFRLLNKKIITRSKKVFFSELLLVGLGFKLSMKKRSLRLNLGYSHAIFVLIPKSVFIVKRKTKLLVYGLHKNLVFDFVYKLLGFKKLNVYKIRGLRLKNSIIKLKPGKRTK